MKYKRGFLAVSVGVIAAGGTLAFLTTFSPSQIAALRDGVLPEQAQAADVYDAVAAQSPAYVGDRKVESQAIESRDRLDESGNSDTAREVSEPSKVELLDELAEYEAKVLQESANQLAEPESAAPGRAVREVKKDFYVAGTDAKTSARMAEILKQNDTLLAQQAEFVKEVSKLRGIMAKARQVQELYVTERERANTLEAKINELKTGDAVAKTVALEEELAEANRQLSRVIDESKTCREAQEGLTSLIDVGEQNKELTDQLSARSGELRTCQEQLQTTSALADSALPLRQQLSAMTNELDLLKEENELLLKGGARKVAAPSRARARASRSTDVQAALLAQPAAPTIANLAARAAVPPAPPSDVLLIEIAVEKASVRSGPGTENSPIMDIGRGARLTVEAQEGEWYRVLTPTGTRGFVHSGVVRRLSALPTQGASAPVAAPPITRVPSPAQQAAAGNPSRTPAQPAARAGQGTQEDSLVPFGSVNMSSRPSTDAEARARELLKNMRSRQGAGAPTPEMIPGIEGVPSEATE